MNTGTDSIGATCAVPPLTMCAARITRLPVTCAVNRPPSPRKPITSQLPAITLSTAGSSFAGEKAPLFLIKNHNPAFSIGLI
jgi:hypothetical protein